jgi:hypothetical protein
MVESGWEASASQAGVGDEFDEVEKGWDCQRRARVRGLLMPRLGGRRVSPRRGRLERMEEKSGTHP